MLAFFGARVERKIAIMSAWGGVMPLAYAPHPAPAWAGCGECGITICLGLSWLGQFRMAKEDLAL